MIGGGLAGMSAALALAGRDCAVDLLERKSIPGGRASSYEAQETGEPVDNCQHILMRCCTNLRQFYAQVGVAQNIRWVRHLHFLEPGGRESVLYGDPRLPAPFHLMPAFFRLQFLEPADKWAVANALMRMLRDPGPRTDRPMADWLRDTRQTTRAIERFWRPILVSALNEEPERCSARYAFMIFRQGFLAHPRAYEMGIPRVPLRHLYDPCVEAIRRRSGRVEFRSAVQGFEFDGPRLTGVRLSDGVLPADAVVSAVPFDVLTGLLPPAYGRDPFFRRWGPLDVSPISAVHLWWDRAVTQMGHAALLDREVQWMFNKTQDYGREGQGTHMGLVVSASRAWLPRPRRELLELAEREVRATFPGTRNARVVKAALIKEARATFSLAPGVDALRPPPVTPIPNLFLAGDWVQNGWPATMEAAVRSGYRAAECVLQSFGRPATLLAPDLPWTAVLGKA